MNAKKLIWAESRLKSHRVGQEGGEKEVAGKKGTEEMLRCFGKKISSPRWQTADLEYFMAERLRGESSSPDRLGKNFIGYGFLVFEPPAWQVDQRTKMRSSSKWISGAFHIGVGVRRILGTVEPVEVRFVVRNPLLDRDWQLVMPLHSSKNSASKLAMT